MARAPKVLAAAVAIAVLSCAPAAAANGSRASSTSHPKPAAVGVSSSASPSPDEPTQPKKPAFWDLAGRVRYAISQWFASLVTAALHPVFDLLGRTVFSTPDVAANQRVVELWRLSAGIADSLLLLLVLVGAGIVTAGSSFSAQTTAKELLPRLFLAAGAVNLSLVVLHQMTELSKALSIAMLGSTLDASTISARMVTMLGLSASSNPFLALFALTVVMLGVLVLVAYVVRVAALVLLATGAPLMLATHALPHTDGLAQTWWRAVAMLLCVPVLQSMLLATTFRVLLSNGGVLGLPLNNGLIDLVVVGCLLYLLYKVTFLSLRYSLSSGSRRAGRRALYLTRHLVSV